MKENDQMMQMNAIITSVNSIDFKRATKDELSEMKTRKTERYEERSMKKKIEFESAEKKDSDQQNARNVRMKNAIKNYDKTKTMTSDRDTNTTNKLQRRLRESRDENTSQMLQKILDQKMKISTFELLSMSASLKKTFFFS